MSPEIRVTCMLAKILVKSPKMMSNEAQNFNNKESM